MISDFQIPDAGGPEAKACWLAAWRAWRAWRELEPPALPDYATPFARPCDRVLCAAKCRADQAGGVLFSAQW
jgi:hypothetical protein